MEIPSQDQTAYCRLCFSQQQMQWFLQSYDDPLVAQIQTFLGITLSTDIDLPCTVCRMCSAILEALDALRQRAMVCDDSLKNNRIAVAASNELDITECKIEPEDYSSSEVELVIEASPTDKTGQSSKLSNKRSKTMVADHTKADAMQSPENSKKGKATPKFNIRTLPERNMLKCKICLSSFDGEKVLENHMKIKHSSTAAAGGLRQYQKRSGEFKPISPKEIRRQMEKAAKNLVCTICNLQFHEWPIYVRHQKIHIQSNEYCKFKTDSKTNATL